MARPQLLEEAFPAVLPALCAHLQRYEQAIEAHACRLIGFGSTAQGWHYIISHPGDGGHLRIDFSWLPRPGSTEPLPAVPEPSETNTRAS